MILQIRKYIRSKIIVQAGSTWGSVVPEEGRSLPLCGYGLVYFKLHGTTVTIEISTPTGRSLDTSTQLENSRGSAHFIAKTSRSGYATLRRGEEPVRVPLRKRMHRSFPVGL